MNTDASDGGEDPWLWADAALRLLRSPQAEQDLAVLNRGIELMRMAVAASTGRWPEHAQFVSNLNNALQMRFERSGDISDLEEAIALGRGAIAEAVADDPNVGAYLSSLGNALTNRFERLGELADLHESIDVNRQAVAAAPLGTAGHAMYLNNLAITLRARFGRLGDLDDINEAIAMLRRAIVAPSIGQSDGARYRNNLCNALQNRFESTGSLADLNEAIEVGRETLAMTPPDRPSRAAYSTNLGLALRLRSERGGGMTDVDESIDVCREAVVTTPHDHPNLAGRLSNLGAALRARFLRTGRLMDLNEAVEVGRRAAASTSNDDASLPVYLANLALALQYRFARTADVADLDEAIAVNERATHATPEGVIYRPMCLSNLCEAFRVRFETKRDGVDLDRAISVGRLAVTATPGDHPSLPWRLSNLAAALWSRYERRGEQVDLDEALDASRRAAEITPPDHPNRPAVLSTQAEILLGQFHQTRVPDLRLRAAAGLREGAMAGSASPQLRVSCGVRWGRLAGDIGALTEAATAWDTVYQQLPLLTDHQLSRADRQHHLAMVEGASSEAAFTALRLDDAARAWQLLEQGRGVLLSQAFETRTDVAALRAVNSDLASAVDNVRLALSDDAPLMVEATPDTSTIGHSWTATISRRRRALHEWGRIVDEVRDMPGFERFALPPTLEELRQTASGGAIVAVNVARHGSDALILTAETAEFVPLPLLSRAEAAQRANGLLLSTLDRSDASLLFDALAWLWDVVALPVLQRLGCIGTRRPGVPSPRIWWVLTGPLAVLPIHAAGRYNDQGATTALDTVVSSYAPTVRALRHAQRPTQSEHHAALTVGLHLTAGQVPLPGAAAEADLAATVLGGTVLRDNDATREAIMAVLPSVTRAHFACHAVTADDPADSHLITADGTIGLRELTDLNLDADLAYLSACTTGVGGRRLMDESIHVASAFQMCGFRHVIATAWPVPDRIALEYAKRIYRRLDGSVEAPFGVHEATRDIRGRYPRHPYAWASHMHFGP